MPEVKPIPLPPKEAEAFWAKKVLTPSDEFDRQVKDAHARAFMVSGINEIDQLSDIYDAIQKAIENGETIEKFKVRIIETIMETGFSANRLAVIFRTNVQSSYMAGRYVQMSRASRLRPFWKYSAVNDSRTRPAHREMNGKIFPADHPVWDTWYPPNGYQCRCTVISYSERQIEKQGLKVEKEDPTGKSFTPVNPKTNKKENLRALVPDEGFDYSVGKGWLSGLSPKEINEKDIFWVENIKSFAKHGKKQFADVPVKIEVPESAFAEYSIKNLVAGSRKKQVAEILKTVSGAIEVPGGVAVFVDAEMFSGLKSDGVYARLIAETIKNPWEVWQVPCRLKDGGKIIPAFRLIRFFRSEAGKKNAVVFTLIKNKYFNVAFKPEKDADKLREGLLIYRSGK